MVNRTLPNPYYDCFTMINRFSSYKNNVLQFFVIYVTISYDNDKKYNFAKIFPSRKKKSTVYSKAAAGIEMLNPNHCT